MAKNYTSENDYKNADYTNGYAKNATDKGQNKSQNKSQNKNSTNSENCGKNASNADKNCRQCKTRYKLPVKAYAIIAEGGRQRKRGGLRGGLLLFSKIENCVGFSDCEIRIFYTNRFLQKMEIGNKTAVK